MNKQDNRLGLSVVATLVAGIALVYTLIMFPQIIFAVAGISLIFIIAAFILTQNILIYHHQKEKASIQQIRDCIDEVSAQMETMGNSRSQIEKATFLYTKQTAKTLSMLENNYAESQEALYKNLTALSSAQNKSTKLMLKYDQSNTTKVISTLKDLRNHLSETMVQGFDQIQPDNTEVVKVLEDIVLYLKSQSFGMDQSMSLQLNNVAHELQNISNSIQNVQIPTERTPVNAMQAGDPISSAAPIKEEPLNAVPAATEEEIPDTAVPEMTEAAPDMMKESIADTPDTIPAEVMEEIPNTNIAEAIEDAPDTEIPDTTITDIPESDYADLEVIEELPEEPEEEPFKPTFTVVGKEPEPVTEPEPVSTVSEDPNKLLSPDEIAALFAAADPAPKKAEKKEEPEPVAVTPVSDDPNKQLTPDEIAALFAAADPAPKKAEKKEEPEPVAVTPVSDDPNKQLTPEEIAALFASMG